MYKFWANLKFDSYRTSLAGEETSQGSLPWSVSSPTTAKKRQRCPIAIGFTKHSKLLSFFFIFILPLICCQAIAQEKKDSSNIDSTKIADSTGKKVKPKFNPRVATFRSAVLPGWGQIYNKKYWKLPLVYGALGTTAGVFVYNVKNYRLLRLAYKYKIDKDTANDALIDPKFKNLSAGALRSYRNSFRQNVDYSVLFFIAFWGLNVADATVDAHLKEFDVNDNLSLHLKQGYSPMANTTGISLVLDIHSKKSKINR